MQAQVHRVSRTVVRAPVRPRAPSREPTARILNGDGSARVKGDVQRVFLYVSNVEAWTNWYPGVASVTRTNGMGGPHTIVGNKYVLEQKIAGLQSLTTYQLAQMDEPRRLVYSGRGKVHTVTDQFVFMSDPNDPSFTVVRYMSNVQLQGTAAALTPVVSGVLNKIPEEAMSKLAKLLNGANSPLASIRPPPKDRQTAGPRKTSTGSTSTSSTTSSKGPSGDLFKSLGGFFSSLASTGSASSLSSVTEEEAAPTVDPRDPQGYYRLLGLDPKTSVAPEDVRSAFRKLAQTLHPDKVAAGAPESKRLEAEQRFKQIQEAYEVLRDVDRKRAYDQGATAGLTSASR